MADTNVLSLRVHIQKTDAFKVMRFQADMLAGDVIKEIREKVDDQNGSKDHGLFMPPNKETGRKGKWLSKDQSLKFHGVTNNMTLEFKKKHRPLKIRLVDDTTKLVIIDDSATVREISDMIGEKIGLKSSDEFSLRKPGGLAKAPLWLLEQQTLHEQDINPETEELEYAKKFYFSDDFIDKDDPFTLHLLYVEANKAIVSSKYPINREKAVEFGALQLQITYGDHDPEKHKPGFFDLNLFLPKAYRKDKNIVKEILRDHRKVVGMNDMNAKYRYVQLVRGLKTYGITFFECEQREKGKKKMISILLGVTREKIVKVDPETQRVVKEWGWNQMRRWSSVKNTFTLDFGDYEDDYLQLFTEEAEALSQLISGYIDIILKSRIDPQRVVDDSDDEVGEVHDMQAAFGLAHSGFTGNMPVQFGQGVSSDQSNSGVQYGFNIPGYDGWMNKNFPKASRINITDLDSAQRAARTLAGELGSTPVAWGQPPANLTESELEKQFQATKTNLVNGLGDLLGQARLGPNGLNRNTLDAKARELALELRSIATMARTLTALNDAHAPLLDGAKAVSDSVADLLKLLMGSADAADSPSFATALEAVEKQIVNAKMLLENAELYAHTDSGTHLLMLEAVHNVESNMDRLMSSVEKAVSRVPPPHNGELQNAITSLEMVKDPIIHNLQNMVPFSVEPKVNQAIRATQATLDNLSKAFGAKVLNSPLPNDAAPEIKEAAERLADALSLLLNTMDVAEKMSIPPDVDIHSPALTLLSTLGMLKDSVDEPKKILEYLRVIAGANNDIVEGATLLQGYVDEDTRGRLTKAAAGVTDSLKDLMECAKVFSKKPTDLDAKEKVVAAATALEEAAHLLLDDVGVITALNNLRYQTKTTAAALIKLAGTATQMKNDVGDRDLQIDLKNAVDKVSQKIPELLQASQVAASRPDDLDAQSELLRIAKTHVPYYSDLAATSKKAARFLPTKGQQQELSVASTETSRQINMLMKAVTDVSDLTGQAEMESALSDFDIIKADLESAIFFAENGVLKPIPGQTRENAMPLLGNAIKSLNDAVVALQQAAKQGNKSPDLIRQAADAAAELATAVKPVAASLPPGSDSQKKILGLAKDIVDSAVGIVGLSRAVAADPTSPPKSQNLDKGVRNFQALLGSLQRDAKALDNGDVEKALNDIKEAVSRLNSPPPPGADFGVLSDQLSSSGKALANSVSNLASVARNSPDLVALGAKIAATSGAQVIEIAGATAGTASDKAMQQQLLAAARSLADALSKLLPSAQNAAQAKTPQSFDAMNKSADVVTDTLADLLGKIGKTGEAESAAARLISLIEALDSDNLNHVVLPGSRQDILNEILSAGKDIGRVQNSLASAARAGDDKLGVFAREAANAATKIAIAAKSAQLSTKNSPGGTDAQRVIQGSDAIIANPTDANKVNSVAKQVTRACGNLLNLAKLRAHEETDPGKRQGLVQAAQKVVSDATELAQAAHAANRKDADSVSALTKAAKTLKSSTIALEDVIGPGHSSATAVDPQTAKKLMTEARALAGATANLIQASVVLAQNPQAKKSQDDLAKKSDGSVTALQNVLRVAGTLNPAVQSVDRAIDVLTKVSSDLDAAAISAQTGGRADVPPEFSSRSVKDVQADTLGVCKTLAFDMKELLVGASGGKPSEELVPTLEKFEKTGPKLAFNALTLGNSINSDASRAQLLTMSRLLTDNLSNFLKAVKASTMGEASARAEMSRYSDSAAKSLGLVLQQIQTGAQLTQGLQRTAEEINLVLSDLHKPAENPQNFSDARENLITTAKEIATLVTTLVSADKKNSGEVGLIAAKIGEEVHKMISAARDTAASSSDEAGRKEILGTAALVGKTIGSTILAAKELTEGSDNLKEFLDGYNNSNVAISRLLSAAKKASDVDRKLDSIDAEVKASLKSIKDADLLSRAGQLTPTDDKTPITTLQGQLVGIAKKVHKAVGTLKDANGNEGDLSAAAGELLKSIRDISGISVATASRIPDSIAQRDILTAARETLENFSNLVTASQHARGVLSRADQNTDSKSPAQSRNEVQAHRDVIQSVGKLVAVVQASSSEASHGERELEMIRQQLLSLLEDTPGVKASVDDVVKALKELLIITREFVFAQDAAEVTRTAKGVYIAAEKFLNTARGSAELSSDGIVKNALIGAANSVGHALANVLEVGKKNREDEATLPALEESNSKVSTNLIAFVNVLKRLPNAEHVKIDELLGDFDGFAEEELRKCSVVIGSAFQKLNGLRPANKPKRTDGVLDQEDINQAIVSACLAISQATGTLVQTSTTALQEKTKFKHQPGHKYHPDPMWAQGLGNAASSVNGSVQSLVKSAQSAVDGNLEEQELENAARAMAASTAQLVAASRSRSDPNSETQRKLKVAGKAVTDATSSLVSAAAAASQFNKQAEEEEIQFNEVVSAAAGKVQELELQMKILKLERELEQEKRKMAGIKKARFNKKQ